MRWIWEHRLGCRIWVRFDPDGCGSTDEDKSTQAKIAYAPIQLWLPGQSDPHCDINPYSNSIADYCHNNSHNRRFTGGKRVNRRYKYINSCYSNRYSSSRTNSIWQHPRRSAREYFTIDRRIMPVVGWISAGYIPFHNPQAQRINRVLLAILFELPGTNFISNVNSFVDNYQHDLHVYC